MSGRLADRSGQGTIELVALAPLVLLVALAVAQWLAAGAARELARHAAEAGAVALLEGGQARDAALRAVPDADRRRLRVVVRGRRVAVTVRPTTVVPGLADLLVARAVAVAGATS
jgi:hypothetical protein